MRAILFFLLITTYANAHAATYQTTTGQRLQLKRNNGTDHPRTGDLGPGNNLRWAGLARANLQKANLRFADLRNANFQNVNLRDASLHRALIGGAGFEGANLRGCDLSGAQLDGADFRGVVHWNEANWKNARYLRGTEPRWPEGFCPKSVGIEVQDEPNRSQ